MLPLKYDETAPQTSPAARPPDANGWHNHAVTVTFQGTDGTSGVATCTQTTYSGPDDPSVALSGTCVDQAGNQSPSALFTTKYDETPPQATATVSRPADVNGWHNHPLTVSYAGSDATSGLASCDPTESYAGPDSASATISGACRDLAGNVAPRSVVVKYDATAPQVTMTPGRAANAAGWYNAPLAVTFAGTDPMSGLASCVQPQTYSGPDNATAAVSGSCSDQAGNVRNASFGLKYDATAPQTSASPARAAGPTGWYIAPIQVCFTAADGTSGVANCDAAKTYAGPDASAATVSGSCRDNAGNSNAGTLPLKYDATAPQVTAAPSRPAERRTAGTARRSPSASPAATRRPGSTHAIPQKSFSGPDSATPPRLRVPAATRPGTQAAHRLRSSTTRRPPHERGALPPAERERVVQRSPHRELLGHGFHLDGSTPVDAAKGYSGPDIATRLGRPASAETRPVTPRTRRYAIKYDATPPQTAAAPSRQPNAAGWYTAPLTVGFSATDATSTVDSCDAAKGYSGPDIGSTTVTGACRDKAGNSDADGVALKYDATAPVASATPSRQPNAAGWYRAPLTVSFAATDATSGLASCPAPKDYAGPDNATASVGGTCLDVAGNAATPSLLLKYDATAPQASATASRPADFGGWFNHALTVSFAATDATSGLASCPVPKSYSGPDDAAASVGGTCLDVAGNAATPALTLKYDATAPQAIATPARGPNANGWYNASVSVGFAGTDATAGVASCEAQKTYSGPDSALAAVVGSCQDRAGNTGATSFGLKYDATAPQTTATPGRAPDSNGWYRASLTVSFAGTDTTAGIESCDAPKSYSGPDNAGASVNGSCRDLAGNSAARSFVLGYDATAPQVTGASPARPTDASGWFNHPVGVAFAGTDATSGIAAGGCTQVTYGGPDNAAASVNGICSDRAGNQSGTSAFGLKYDGTAPVANAAAGRPADANGWYNHSLTVSFSGSDATSGLQSCPAPKLYAGPDSSAAAVSGTCSDQAGNPTVASLPFKYDATAPAAATTPARAPDVNDWYNQPVAIAFSASDALSGLQSCPPAVNYQGPDSSTAVVSGTCTDNAGNGALASRLLKYDDTAPTALGAPSRPADANGWYNHSLTVGFDGSDVTSGIASCTASSVYAGPDAAAVSKSGTCTDRAGNPSAATTFPFKYDATNPTVGNPLPARPPDRAGWYNRPVGFAVQGTDAMSGIDSCPPQSYTGPDSATASFAGACLDKAGNRGTRSFTLSYDATGPATSATADRSPDSSGWFNQPLTVSFSGTDAVSGTDSCSAPENYSGPDSVEAVVGGVCVDKAGNVGLASLSVSYDATAPVVTTAEPDRRPDANGWYNHPLVVGFRGSDATSGIAGCTQAAYAGPDSSGTTVTGSCQDHAGNAGGSLPFELRFDSTAPAIGGLRVKPGNGSAVLTWTASPDTTLVEIHRGTKRVYSGTGTTFTDKGLSNGVRYRYTLKSYDEAANSSTEDVAATPSGPLVSPAAGAVVTAPPRLAWKAVPKATYYHVQLWRQGRILSAWPRGTSFRLRRSWIYNGRRYRLAPGHYRWYVWPGRGRPAQHKFGGLIGSSSFRVR